ncbi:hypothetical protein G6F70_008016 [Rhizopus microsporus]|uniref:Phosphatase activator n=2 Tax=Rhizopus TaxID=4842 RepID=A0A367J5R0_RHIAZ|nr:hypothetical protein G6F71_008007 [Rhizopus microsporus]RCH85304.1 hypothetical protein CU097_007452 [Rhizopus azygosporus]KAG1195731.1 hypothetical protein G6F70_008016 [Rhizopus microsporus]KAG1207574.1 hypothetical protein G6F69_007938 [Rhizopus microsporus]KAG1228422.1 hypothetical protein G6F67_007833 [Rhizopus microsporus]
MSANNSNISTQDTLIYQVQQYDDLDTAYENTPDTIPQTLYLDLRGIRMKLDKETLVSLPESLLIAMFPNGLVLGKQSYDSEEEDEYDDSEFQSSDSNSEDLLTTHVDFDPKCLEYVLDFYKKTLKEKKMKPEESLFAFSQAAQYYPSILDKVPVIVLREELEYYCIHQDKKDPIKLKLAAGEYLKNENLVFAALQKNIARANNVAEQHLIDMLCHAGFSREDRWGHRELEPNRTCINSMSLVALKSSGTDHTHQLDNTAQKLLLFWRKPARKCWWDGNTVHIDNQPIRLWARRTWTLELVMI